MMQKTTFNPSIISIIKVDFITFFAVIFPVVVWGMYAIVILFGYLPNPRGDKPIGPEGASFFFNFGFITLLVSIPIVLWRIGYIRNMFARGYEIPSQITNIGFFRGRGRVEYAYTYQDRQHRGWNGIMKVKQTQNLISGDNVILIVDPDNPKRALIRDFYIKF